MMPLLLLVCCGASFFLLAVAVFKLRGTTLVSPLAWSLAAVSSLAIAEVVLFFPPMPGVTSWHSLVRYVAGTVTLLPAISLLGAKRPQALLWNYIVVSLWVVLIMPAVEVLLLKPQQTFEIYAFGPWMIAGLVFYTAIHYAGTSMTLAGLLIAASQCLYLAPFLPLVQREGSSVTRLIAATLVLAAVLWAFWCAKPMKAENEFSRIWRNFKNAYGTAWSLRIIQRLDELQVRHRWAVRLGWNGVEPVAFEIDPKSPKDATVSRKELAKAFRSLMLKFLSPKQFARFSAEELKQKSA